VEHGALESLPIAHGRGARGKFGAEPSTPQAKEARQVPRMGSEGTRCRVDQMGAPERVSLACP
jgi:hypothetical protein